MTCKCLPGTISSNLYRHGFRPHGGGDAAGRIGDPRHTSTRRSSSCGRPRATRRCSPSFPSSAFPRTAARTFFTSAPCSTAAESALAQPLRERAACARRAGRPAGRGRGRLYNCAALVCRGRLVGVVPKTYLPNYREFYEARQFTPATAPARRDHAGRAGRAFGTNLLFRLAEMPSFRAARRDLRGPVGARAAVLLRGAPGRHRVGNLSASNITTARRATAISWSPTRRRAALRPTCTARAGFGESTTDLAWGRPRMITRTARCSPSRSASAAARRSRSPTSISTGCWADRCGRTLCRSARPATRPRWRPVRSVEFSLPLPRGACRSSAASAASLRAGGRGEPRPALAKRLPHPVQGPRHPHAGDGHQESSSASPAGWIPPQALLGLRGAPRRAEAAQAQHPRLYMPASLPEQPARANQAWQLMRRSARAPRKSTPGVVHADAEGTSAIRTPRQ